MVLGTSPTFSLQIMSPGLQRARQPFRLRNAITGVVLAGFAVGVWAYSIGAVKQDKFDDVDEEARALMAGSGLQRSEDRAAEGQEGAAEGQEGAADASKTVAPSGTVLADVVSPTTPLPTPTRHRGVLPQLLEHRIPGLFDPTTGTLVWGAPPVDNIGKLRDAGIGRRIA
ncbi:hypothetical protein L227DRAFT_648061 [Lentinus tigrinus ALCF2SS1-6]|uniref:Cytochrome c oxidase assembly factor 3 n=1 Tax=Lentinus tigrinus ALCF2SS1-6 TaxID=1328759 RepID=A0A5C2STW9_9APHY|nr:hypothetical protein L227DRAFT_648061 [Lentinus tigrinus ALCF2SS1-6]